MAPSSSHPLRALSFVSGKRNAPPSPPSPTFSDVTQASALNFGADGPAKIITRADLRASLQSYEDLMKTCLNYRAVLLGMSKATAAFADAMERCSGLKGLKYETAARVQAAAGVHHLIGNLWHVLAETLDKTFEKPLRQQLETYRTVVNDRSASYERSLREKSRVIRETELRSLNRKDRNLQNFREALVILQRQVDELDELKVAYYQEIMDHEEEVWDVVQGKVCIVVRSTMDVFDRITAKSSDPILEPMLQSVPDPFDSYGPPPGENHIFSILSPLSIMTSTPSVTPSRVLGNSEPKPTTVLPTTVSKISSWLPGTSNSVPFPTESTEWASVPSTFTTLPHLPSSPPSSGGKNKWKSGPAGQHKTTSESKLRSILTVIDEGSKAHSEDDEAKTPMAPSLSKANGKMPTSDHLGWTPSYGQSPHDEVYSDQSTPRASPTIAPVASQMPVSESAEDPNQETAEPSGRWDTAGEGGLCI